jgi:hypothetical protein
LQVPKPFWQPDAAAQWPVVDPHQPYCEQHVPNEDPEHVKPRAPAQVPSVEAFLAGTAAAEVAAGLTEVAAPVPGQVPKAELQPVEQKSAVVPQ